MAEASVSANAPKIYLAHYVSLLFLIFILLASTGFLQIAAQEIQPHSPFVKGLFSPGRGRAA